MTDSAEGWEDAERTQAACAELLAAIGAEDPTAALAMAMSALAGYAMAHGADAEVAARLLVKAIPMLRGKQKYMIGRRG